MLGVMRLVALCLLVGACGWPASDVQSANDDDGNYGPAECAAASDCVLASTTCCGCAEFAMPDEGWSSGCEDIECPEPEGACPAVTAACIDGSCALACAPLECDLSCDGGFVRDSAGCLACECAGGDGPVAECSVDTDCVQVPADCCGCADGGADTAVPASEAESMMDSLMCPTDPACPDVDVCDPSLTARCLGGTCTLTGMAGTDAVPGECGTPELPPCPDGTVCVLNADDEASSQGVGTCQPGA